MLKLHVKKSYYALQFIAVFVECRSVYFSHFMTKNIKKFNRTKRLTRPHN